MTQSLTPRILAVARRARDRRSSRSPAGSASCRRSGRRSASLDAKIADEQAKLTVAQLARAVAEGRQAEDDRHGPAREGDAVEPADAERPPPGSAPREHVERHLESFTPSAATPAAGYDAVPIDLSVSGRYASVQSFLHRLCASRPARTAAASTRTAGCSTCRPSASRPAATRATELTASIRLAAFVYTGAPLPATDTTTTTAPAAATGRRPDERDHAAAGAGGAAGSDQRRQLILLAVLSASSSCSCSCGSCRSSSAAPARRARTHRDHRFRGRSGSRSRLRRRPACRRAAAAATDQRGRRAHRALDQAPPGAGSVRAAGRQRAGPGDDDARHDPATPRRPRGSLPGRSRSGGEPAPGRRPRRSPSHADVRRRRRPPAA